MKPILTLAAIVAAAAPGAHAAERQLTGVELRRMITEGALLCEAPREALCGAIVRWDAATGPMRETRLETLAAEPALDVAMQLPLRIEGDQVCLTIRAEQIGFLITVGGVELTGPRADAAKAAMQSVWAGAEGRIWCTAYYRDTITGALRAEVRIDGRARVDLDGVFEPIETSPLPALRVVRQPWSAGVLRAVAPAEASSTTTSADQPLPR